MSSKKIRKANINGVIYDLTVQDAELYNDVIIKLKRDAWVSSVVEGESVFTQTVHVDGATSDSTPAIFLQGSNNLGGTDEEYEAYSKLINVITSSNQFIFVASEAPTIDFRVISKATIAAEGSQITEIENMQEDIEELNDGMYNVGRALSYSTEETVVGVWIDGKPIYRKVLIAYTPSSDDVSKMVVIIDKNDLPQIDFVVKLDGVIRGDLRDGNTMALNHCQNNSGGTQYYSTVIYTPSIGIRQNIGAVAYSNLLEYIYLEYTKTTDTPHNA